MAPKKKAFDRGGPGWPPRSNAKYDRLGGGLGGLCPQPKTGGSGGQRPAAKSLTETFLILFSKKFKICLMVHSFRTRD